MRSVNNRNCIGGLLKLQLLSLIKLQFCLKHFHVWLFYMQALKHSCRGPIRPFALKPSERKIFRTLLQHKAFVLGTGTIENCFKVRHCMYPGRVSSSETQGLLFGMRYFRAKEKFRDVWNDQNPLLFGEIIQFLNI